MFLGSMNLTIEWRASNTLFTNYITYAYLWIINFKFCRAVLWTAEEEALIGANSYFNDHINETDNFDAVMESDEGTFTPTGLQFYGTEPAACIIEEILKYL